MKADHPAKRRQRTGIFIHGNTLWFSELTAMGMVMALLVSLMSISTLIFVNFLTIRGHDRGIAELKRERINLEDATGNLNREVRIITVMRMLAGTNVRDSALCRLARSVSRSSGQFGYDPLLLLAVIRVESVFNPGARGRFISGTPSGAIGLMQLKFETASEIAGLLGMHRLTEDDLYNPEINLVIGVAYLTQLISQFKSFKLGISAFNQGPGTVYHTLSGREPLSLEYYQKVLKNYYQLKKLEAAIE